MDYYHLILEYLVDNDFVNKTEPINDFLKKLMGENATNESELRKVWHDLDKLGRDKYIAETSFNNFWRPPDFLNTYQAITLKRPGVDYISERRVKEAAHSLLSKQTSLSEEANMINVALSTSIIATNKSVRLASNATTDLYTRTERYYVAQALVAVAIAFFTFASVHYAKKSYELQEVNSQKIPPKENLLQMLKEDTSLSISHNGDTVQVFWERRTVIKKKK